MKLSRTFTKTYLIAFLSLVLLIGASQWLLQTLIIQREQDAYLVNLAGRQRMLSQRMIKLCLLIQEEPHQENIYKLDTTLRYWQNTHQKLAQNPENTEEILTLQAELNPIITSIGTQVSAILKNHRDSAALQRFLSMDQVYIDTMNLVVAQMAKDASQKLKQLQKIELLLAGLCVLLLVGETAFIFRPLMIKTDNYLQKIENDSTLIKTQNNELETLNEELKQNFEELQVAQEKVLSQKEIIEKQNAFQKAILDNAALMMISINTEGLITSFNPAAEVALGYKAEEIVNKHKPFIFHDPAKAQQRARELSEEFNRHFEVGLEMFTYKTQKGLRNVFESIYIRKDGAKFPVFLNISALRVENNIIGYMGIIEDISEKKAQEILLKQQKELIEKQSAYQKAILDNAALMIISTTPEGTITSFNPAAEDTLGYRATELIDKHTPSVFHDFEEVQERAKELSEQFNEKIEAGFQVFVYRTQKGLQNAAEWT